MKKVFDCIISFLKIWLLPTAMCTGTAIYLLFAKIPALAPAKPFFLEAASYLMPTAIFLMLFFTFCKIDFKEMKPRRWHAATLVLQTVLSVLCAVVIIKILRPSSAAELVAEGVLACLISPTASAAAVVTGKLGGSAASLTSYTLESNILSAFLITFICPVIHPVGDMHIINAFTMVLIKVSQLLILPFLLAMFVKYTMPRLHSRFAALKDIAFYIWGCSLTMVTGMTMRVVFASLNRPHVVVALVIGALLVCLLKFVSGWIIGGTTCETDRISAGQALGQKNTMFTIWMALTYLSPIAAVAPGSYVLWQNMINSWELWKKDKENKKKAVN